MGDTMFMSETWEEFLKDYEFKDHKELYTNGSMLIQSFRVKQMMEHYARPKRGRWEECDWVEYDGHSECVRYPKKGRVCTSCRNAFKKEFIDSPRVNYCPNCGAKMDGDSYV